MLQHSLFVLVVLRATYGCQFPEVKQEINWGTIGQISDTWYDAVFMPALGGRFAECVTWRNITGVEDGFRGTVDLMVHHSGRNKVKTIDMHVIKQDNGLYWFDNEHVPQASKAAADVNNHRDEDFIENAKKAIEGLYDVEYLFFTDHETYIGFALCLPGGWVALAKSPTPTPSLKTLNNWYNGLWKNGIAGPTALTEKCYVMNTQ